MAVDHAFWGGMTLILVGAGLTTGGIAGPLGELSLTEIGIVSILAAGGAAARAFLNAKEAREKAANSGTPPDKLPKIDLISLGYALIGAPFMGSVGLAAIRAGGDVLHFPIPAYGIAPAIMAMGYYGKDAIEFVRSIGSRALNQRGGGDGK